MSSLASLRFWIGIAISLLCLWLAVREVPFAELGHSLATANYLLLLPAIVLQFLGILARAKRWVILLDKEDHLFDSFWAQTIGYLFTNVLPLRLGEPARVIVMSQRCRLPIVRVAATAIVERLMDIGSIVLLLILVLPWMRVPDLVLRAGLTFGVLIALAPLVLVLLLRFSDRFERLLQSGCEWCKFLPADSIIARWRELLDGLRPLVSWRIGALSISWSFITWALAIATQWLILRMFQPDGSLVEAVFMLVALAFAVSVPSSPGFVGIYQLVGQQALVLPFAAKYDATSALAITLTAHLTYYLTTTGAGVIGMWRLGESFASLERLIARRRSAPKEASSNVA